MAHIYHLFRNLNLQFIVSAGAGDALNDSPIQVGCKNVLSQSYVREIKRFQTKIGSSADDLVENIAMSHKSCFTL